MFTWASLALAIGTSVYRGLKHGLAEQIAPHGSFQWGFTQCCNAAMFRAAQSLSLGMIATLIDGLAVMFDTPIR
jgi:hypothetical protein